MKIEFEVGDVVMLNSGGPRMAITSVNADAICVAWSSKDGFTQVGSFPVQCVRSAEGIGPNGY
jgi:uncharacterized protein YodC (DUF2158 family)